MQPDLAAMRREIVHLLKILALVRAPDIRAHVAEAVEVRAFLHRKGRRADVPDQDAGLDLASALRELGAS